MRKNLYLPFILSLIFFSCGERQNSSPKTVRLKGQLLGMGATEVRMSYNGASSLLGNSRDIILKTDAQGFFDTTFVLNEPAYYNISRNTLYLSPGDDLTVKITTDNKEAQFSGTSALVNTYMKERLFPKGGSFIESGKNITGDFMTTKNTIDSLATIRLHQLDTLSNAPAEFKKLETARVKADIVNSYIYYPGYAGYVKEAKKLEFEIPDGKVHLETIAPFVIPILKEINDTLFLDVAVVRDVFSLSTDSMFLELFFRDIVFPDRTKELFAGSMEVGKLSNDITPETADEVGTFTQAMKNRDFAKEIELKIAQATGLFAGQPAIDFVLDDTEGNPKRLSDFKGKVLYIDLWATWCGPCIQESPFYESLAQQYSTDEVVFLPVSTDKSKEVWLSYVNKNPKKLTQYHSTDITLQEGWNLQYIPRFLLIDKDFKIVSAYAPRPSTEEAGQAIDQLLARQESVFL